MRDLVLVLGDQLSAASPAFHGFNAKLDAVPMIEAANEAEPVREPQALQALDARLRRG